MTVTVLSGCWTTSLAPETNRGVCDGLENPLVAHTKSIVDEQEETPAGVIQTGATLVQAYRAACD